MTTKPAPLERDWSRGARSFSHPSPVLFSPHRGDPEAPEVILCHGMGESPERARDRWPQLCSLPVHLIAPAGPFPHEVRRDDTLRIGHAWYLYDGSRDLFKESLDRAAAWLRAAVLETEETAGLHPSARALVGHSQGAYFGFVAALGNQDLFSHLAAVAGRLEEEFVAAALAHGGSLETLIVHGREDRAVSAEAAHRSAGALKAAGYPVTVRLLPGGHGIRPDRDETVTAWLRRAWGL